MYNEYFERLNDMDKKDYKKVERECKKILHYHTVYDVVTYLNDYIYDLSDTVNNNYFLAIGKLEDHYMNIYRKGF